LKEGYEDIQTEGVACTVSRIFKFIQQDTGSSLCQRLSVISKYWGHLNLCLARFPD